MSSSASYLDPVVLPLIRGESVLDAGCGVGRWCHLIESNYWEAGLEHAPAVDGFDAFARNVERCERSGCYRRVWQQTLPGTLDDSWDTVLAIELIEHIDERHVQSVLDELERVARLRVIVSTPNFPAFREGVVGSEGLNDYDAHLSYVARDVFRRRGYRLIGAGFGNPRHPLVRIGRRLKLAATLETFPRRFPSLGESIVAVKDVAPR